MSAFGLIDLHMVPQGTNMNARYCIYNIPEDALLLALKRTKRSGPVYQRNITTKRSELVFIQDGAPAKAAKATQGWCSENLPAFLKKGECPPNSPDLNPVENLWCILNEKVFLSQFYVTIVQLKSEILMEWHDIDANILNNFVHSMTKRLNSVREQNRGHSDL